MVSRSGQTKSLLDHPVFDGPFSGQMNGQAEPKAVIAEGPRVVEYWVRFYCQRALVELRCGVHSSHFQFPVHGRKNSLGHHQFLDEMLQRPRTRNPALLKTVLDDTQHGVELAMAVIQRRSNLSRQSSQKGLKTLVSEMGLDDQAHPPYLDQVSRVGEGSLPPDKAADSLSVYTQLFHAGFPD